MDPLTHALLGAATAQSISRSRKAIAAVAGLAGALLPDADVLIASGSDPLLTLEYHRQFTHSVVAAPVGALVAASVVWAVLRRRAPFGHVYWAALAGYFSAIVLDACTSYGTQLLWPFSETRFAGRIVAVIDPAVTLVLLTGVILALRAATAGPARLAVGLVIVYLAFGALQRERAEAVARGAAAERGHIMRQHEVKPTLGNLILWRSVYRAGEEYVVDAVRIGLFSAPVLYAGGVTRRVEPADLVPPLSRASVQANDVVRFARVSEGYLARHPSRAGVIGDIRYSMLPDSTTPLWGIEIDPTREQTHVRFLNFRQFTEEDRQRFIGMLFGIPRDSRGEQR